MERTRRSTASTIPDYRGVLSVPRENLFEMAKTANELGWQMTAHTTGGGATDLLLDAYEAADRDRSHQRPQIHRHARQFSERARPSRARRNSACFRHPALLALPGRPGHQRRFRPRRA